MNNTSPTEATPEAPVTYSYHYRSQHRYHFLLWCVGVPVVISPLVGMVAPLLVNEALVVLAVTVPITVGGMIGMLMQWKSRVSTTALVLNRVLGSILLCTMVWGYCLVGGVSWTMNAEQGIGAALLSYLAFSFMYTLCISPLILVWLGFVTNGPYEPGEATRLAEGDINRFKLLSRDVSMTQKQRAELIGELARHDVDELLFVLGSDVFNADAIKLVATRLLEEIEPNTVQSILGRAIPVIQERTLNTFMEVWQEHPNRMTLFLALARQSVIQTHSIWSYVLVDAAHQADMSGAQMAAITALSHVRAAQRESSFEYIEKFGVPAHIPHLVKVRDAIALNMQLRKRIDEAIARIEVNHGGIRGGLSLSVDDSTRGGLSHVEPQDNEG